MELLYILPTGWDIPPSSFSLTPAHLRYRLGPGPRLLGGGLTPALRGGAMVVGGPAPPGDPACLCRQIMAECARRCFDRVIFDGEGAPTEPLGRLAAALGESCQRAGLPLYLPETLAPYAPHCRVLVSSALRSGTLEGRLGAAAERYGTDRIALAVEVLAEDAPLPVRGAGEPLEREALDALMARLEPAVFFDRGLCAHYFTYLSRGGQAHFVLFDTPRSVREKLSLAGRLGVPSALLAAPQTEGWLEEILR